MDQASHVFPLKTQATYCCDDPGASKTPFRNDELCTLANGLMLCMAHAPSNLRDVVHKQLRPQWLQALAAHPPSFKFMVIKGRLVRKPALPLDIGLPLIQQWIPAVIDRIRMEVNQLSTSLDALDQAMRAANGDGDDVEIVTDDDDDVEIVTEDDDM